MQEGTNLRTLLDIDKRRERMLGNLFRRPGKVNLWKNRKRLFRLVQDTARVTYKNVTEGVTLGEVVKVEK